MVTFFASNTRFSLPPEKPLEYKLVVITGGFVLETTLR